MLHSWKRCSMSIILHILLYYAEILWNIDFFKSGTAPLKGGLDIWKCTLHSFKGHGATFQWILHIFVWILPLQKHTALPPKEDYSYSEGYVCFEYCICWQVWGCYNYFESFRIFCRNYVLSKWPWRRSAWSRRSEDLNRKLISVISFDEGFLSMQSCHQLCIVLLAHVKNYCSFVLSSTIFNTICFSHTFDGHLVNMRVLA